MLMSHTSTPNSMPPVLRRDFRRPSQQEELRELKRVSIRDSRLRPHIAELIADKIESSTTPDLTQSFDEEFLLSVDLTANATFNFPYSLQTSRLTSAPSESESHSKETGSQSLEVESKSNGYNSPPNQITSNVSQTSKDPQAESDSSLPSDLSLPDEPSPSSVLPPHTTTLILDITSPRHTYAHGDLVYSKRTAL